MRNSLRAIEYLNDKYVI